LCLEDRIFLSLFPFCGCIAAYQLHIKSRNHAAADNSIIPDRLRLKIGCFEFQNIASKSAYPQSTIRNMKLAPNTTKNIFLVLRNILSNYQQYERKKAPIITLEAFFISDGRLCHLNRTITFIQHF
jgi:hypothetical protein